MPAAEDEVGDGDAVALGHGDVGLVLPDEQARDAGEGQDVADLFDSLHDHLRRFIRRR